MLVWLLLVCLLLLWRRGRRRRHSSWERGPGVVELHHILVVMMHLRHLWHLEQNRSQEILA